MGSRNSDGTIINQPDFRLHHIGTYVNITSQSGVDVSVPNTDTTVERQKFTSTGVASGSLAWQATRKISGIHSSVTEIEADSSLGPSEAVSERKIFFLPSDRNLSSGFADWTVFDTAGEATGATTGTTDTDVTPSGTFNERPSFDG